MPEAAIVETNWILDVALGQHEPSISLMNLAQRGEVQLFLPDGSNLSLRSDDTVVSAIASGGQAIPFAGSYSSIVDFERLYAKVPFDSKRSADALSVMRKSMAAQEDARFLVGGSLAGSGHFPGVLEEALASITAGKLVLPLAAFGGAAHDAALALGLLPSGPYLERKTKDPALHPRYGEIIASLKTAQPSYLAALEAHGIEWKVAVALAQADSADTIAELARDVLHKAFGEGRAL